MALGYEIACNTCSRSFTVWDEGDPYYLDEHGQKRHAYHPTPERQLCIGVDSPHLCLSCGHEFTVDSRSPVDCCPRCSAPQITSTWHLPGKNCPFCKQGSFALVPNSDCIS